MRIIFKARFVVPSILLISGLSGQAMGAQGWQERRLLSPSATQQRTEQQGKVYIYDGLHEETVEQALDTQFDRVQHMMFIGTRHTDGDGEEPADDDC
jgi:hypothetical protein